MHVPRYTARTLNATPLMQAAFSTTVSVDAMMALTTTTDPKAVDSDGRNALMLAAWQGGVEKVRALLPLSDVQHQDAQGVNALMVAAGMSTPATLAALLPGSDPKALDKQGMNPLMHAVRNAKVDNIPMLALVCPVTQQDSKGNTLLSYALKAGPKTLRIALSLLPVDTPQSHGETVLMQAAQTPDQPAKVLLPLLLQAGADPRATDEYGRTPLHHAVAHGPVATDLLMPVSDLGARDLRGRTVLHHAAAGTSPAALAHVLDVWPERFVGVTDHQGRTPLWSACESLVDVRNVRMLLAAGADVDVNAPDHQGVTPLLAALTRSAESEGPAFVQTLLDHGADPLARDHADEGVLERLAAIDDEGTLTWSTWAMLMTLQGHLPVEMVTDWAERKGLLDVDSPNEDDHEQRVALVNALNVRREQVALNDALNEVSPADDAKGATLPARPRL